MKRTLTLLAAATACLAAAQLSPQQVAGKWSGKIEGKLVPPPGAKVTAQELKQVETMFRSMVFELTVNANKTFAVRATRKEGGKNVTENASGTWTLKGNQLTMVDTMRNGKKIKDERPTTFVLSKDGKTLTSKIPQAGSLALIFRKR